MLEFVRNRITQLRIEKGVSEYQMSYDLGHSRGYINNITSGKSDPSLKGFFDICDYFGISPQAFFDAEHERPEQVENVIELICDMNDEDIGLLITLVERINREK